MFCVHMPQNSYLAFLGQGTGCLVKTVWQPCCVV